MNQPALPLPEPLRGKESGTWAHSTITVRLPEIAGRVLVENEFPAEIIGRLRALIAEIPQGPLRFLADGAPDTAEWKQYTRPYLGQNWLEPPWFFIETYFYRRILEATGYFQPGAGAGIDPFAYQKRRGLETTRAAIHALSERLPEWLAGGWQPQSFATLLAIDLWGNQADLSLWPADEEAQPQHDDLTLAQAHLLADDTQAVCAHLARHPQARVDFLADNAGFELVADLCLAGYLLGSGAAQTAVFHLKMHPTFVSDAMIKDVRHTVAFLRAEAHPATRALGEQLADFVENGRLRLTTHPFWTSPLAFWQLPPDLHADLARSQLIISKGDANYRRLLGDRHWPYDTPFAAITRYTPAPLLALRTLKAELAAGLSPEQVRRLNREEADWMVNGRWGVIQFNQAAKAGK